MSMLSDGTVIPAHLSASNDGVSAALAVTYQNNSLRVGYLTAIHYPGDEKYENTRDILYDAVVQQGTSDVYVPYRKCKLANFLGHGKDWEKRVLRCPASYKGSYSNPDFLNNTTRVLLLCANGQSDSPYIIAADSAASSPTDKRADGHMWGWEFNGVNWLIDKNGQLTLTHKGPTADENNINLGPNPEVAGSFLKFDQDGSITLDDAKGESVTIDKKNKKIIINSRESEQNVTEKGWTVEVAKDVKIHAGGNVILSGDGKTYIGKEGAAEPLVLGNQLVAALSELIAVLSQPVIGALGQAPVMTNPAVLAGLAQWQAKYGIPTAPILSKKKFTE